jgi:hypothetical protein
MVLVQPGWRAAAVSVSLLTALSTVGLAPAATADQQSQGSGGGMRVVATKLDNPRHLEFSGGALYVAEAGQGGSGPCWEGAEGPTCYGPTGAITRIRNGKQARVVRGLPSAATASGGGAVGPSDLRVKGHRYTMVLGLGADPTLREGKRRGVRRLATLASGRFHSSQLRVIADIGAHEIEVNPEPTDLDTNPVALLPRGRRTYVVDAGANALLEVSKRGRVRTRAVFPPVEGNGADPVPTSAAYGPDGALYVSQLTGFPFTVGSSSIWRVAPGRAPVKWATGLTNVTDLAFDRNGRLYVVQIAANGLTAGANARGSVVRIARNGGNTHTTIQGGLLFPYGIALHGGAAYVTTHSAEANVGEVVRIPLP